MATGEGVCGVKTKWKALGWLAAALSLIAFGCVVMGNEPDERGFTHWYSFPAFCGFFVGLAILLVLYIAIADLIDNIRCERPCPSCGGPLKRTNIQCTIRVECGCGYEKTFDSEWKGAPSVGDY